MNSDIKLNENILILEADRVDVTAADIILDSAARRKEGMGGPYRRALVHDFNDGLTINYNADYPGGVTIMGKKINLPGLDKPAPAPTDAVDKLRDVTSIRGDFQVNEHIRNMLVIKAQDISTMFDEVESPVNLIKEIRRLRNAVVALDKRVKELEASK